MTTMMAGVHAYFKPWTWRDFSLWLASVATGSLVAFWLATINMERAVTYLHPGDVVPLVDGRPTNDLAVLYRGTRWKTCHNVRSRYLLRMLTIDGQSVRDRVDLFTSQDPLIDPSPLEQTAIAHFTLPPAATTGDWDFISRTEVWCSPVQYFWPQIVQSPPVPVHIVRPPDRV